MVSEPRETALRHDSDVKDLDMHNNGHVNNQSECTVWHYAYLSLRKQENPHSVDEQGTSTTTCTATGGISMNS